MNKIEYTTVESHSTLDLDRKVNETLEEGWKLYGGIIFSPINDSLIQAFIREVDPNDIDISRIDDPEYIKKLKLRRK